LPAISQQKYDFYLRKPNLSLSFFKLEHLQMEIGAQKKEMKQKSIMLHLFFMILYSVSYCIS